MARVLGVDIPSMSEIENAVSQGVSQGVSSGLTAGGRELGQLASPFLDGVQAGVQSDLKEAQQGLQEAAQTVSASFTGSVMALKTTLASVGDRLQRALKALLFVVLAILGVVVAVRAKRIHAISQMRRGVKMGWLSRAVVTWWASGSGSGVIPALIANTQGASPTSALQARPTIEMEAFSPARS